jgi:hypothetical protein
MYDLFDTAGFLTLEKWGIEQVCRKFTATQGVRLVRAGIHREPAPPKRTRH